MWGGGRCHSESRRCASQTPVSSPFLPWHLLALHRSALPLPPLACPFICQQSCSVLPWLPLLKVNSESGSVTPAAGLGSPSLNPRLALAPLKGVSGHCVLILRLPWLPYIALVPAAGCMVLTLCPRGCCVSIAQLL